MSFATALIKTLRPHQWVKNLFVAAPLVFSRHLLDAAYAWRSAAAVAIFCALSGAVYAFNDVHDVEADRAHPTKRRRPIASGALSIRTATMVSALLALAGLSAAFALTPLMAVVAGGYLLNNLAYSLRLKHIAFLDVAMIAGGFLLRVYAGAVAIDVPASRWLLICTASLALFLGLGKRAHELAWSQHAEPSDHGTAKTRAALAGYRLTLLRPLMMMLGVVTCLAYAGYTRSQHTVDFFGTGNLIFTAPFPVLGIARFLMLSLWKPKAESPTEAMLRDPFFIANIVAWGIAVVVFVYR
jgi:decaprenyl-phosphate phosphoribosyltransferase